MSASHFDHLLHELLVSGAPNMEVMLSCAFARRDIDLERDSDRAGSIMSAVCTKSCYLAILK